MLVLRESVVRNLDALDRAARRQPETDSPGGGREIMQISYFCVPFRELATGTVSYADLYEGLRGRQLPRERRALILAAARPAAAPDGRGMLATRAAALLLTGKPVCIVGAGRVPADERLRFLDTVASLLPYGMRSRLSAATWTSSTYQQHRFRLFFASRPRQRDDDHVLDWGEAGPDPAGDPQADAYLSWLRDDIGWRAAALARETAVTDFTEPSVHRLLARLGIVRGQADDAAEIDPPWPPPGPDIERVWVAPPSGSPYAQPAPPPRAAGSREVRPPERVERLLRSVAQHLGSGDPRPGIKALRSYLDGGSASEEQQRYRRVIRETGLLRAEQAADPMALAELYDVLLPLAFGRPLTYDGLCGAEDCVGAALRPSLLLAMDDHETDTVVTRALVRLLRRRAADDGSAAQAPPISLPQQQDLIAVAVQPGLRRHHADLAWDALRECAADLDRRALQKELRQQQYFTRQLAAGYPGEPEHQVTAITRLLRLAYGSPLGESAVRDALGSCEDASPPALLAAVLVSGDPGTRSRSRLRRVLLQTVGQVSPGMTAQFRRPARHHDADHG